MPDWRDSIPQAGVASSDWRDSVPQAEAALKPPGNVASFGSGVASGFGSGLNPKNIVNGLAETFKHPMDALSQMDPDTFLKEFHQAEDSKDYEALGKHVGGVIASLLLAKGAGALGEAAPGIAEAVKGAPEAIADTAKNVAGNPVAKVAGNFLAKRAASAVPGGRLAMDLWDAYDKLKAKSTATDSKVTTNVDVSPTISPVEITANTGKGFRASDRLDAETTTALAKATQDGTLQGLTKEDKKAVVEAVKSGDNDTVKSILTENVGNRTAQGSIVDQNVMNKVAVLARYAKDHGIDLSKVDASARQQIADAAISHAKTVPELVTPKSGKYKGISDDTMKAVMDQLK